MLGTAEIVAAVAEALDLLEPGTPVVIDPVMVAESGAVLLDDAARAALVEQLLPRATVITPNLPEARVLAGDPGAGRRGRSPARCTASAPRTSSSPAATATRRPTSSSTASGSHLIPGERHPDGAAHGSGCTHSSALAAHLALGLDAARGRARPPSAIAAEAVRDGLRGIGAGAGPVDVLGLTAAVAPPLRTPARLGYSRPTMKFLRMRPGFGEQLIAEGDVEVADEHEALVEEFRRQLDQGMWAAVPTDVAPTAAARPRWSARSSEIPRDTDRVIFFPRAAGGASRPAGT